MGGARIWIRIFRYQRNEDKSSIILPQIQSHDRQAEPLHEDTNNNPVTEMEAHLHLPPQLPTLASQPTAAASVASFYQRLQKSHGPVLDSLHCGDICLAADLATYDYAPVLESLAEEQLFEVKFLQLESVQGAEQSLVQILADGQPHAVTVCLGTGPGSKNSAAR